MAVFSGILLSRLVGFVRLRAQAHFLGNSAAAGAYAAAVKIPNLLQNLLGEGVLSASFIPVYSRLLAEGKKEEADVVARTVVTLLVLVASAVTLLGVVFTRVAIDFIAAGFTGDVRELTIHLVRIFFPGTALLVLSAWCLGVLNSHRRFFLSYASPVLWNGAIITFIVIAGRRLTLDRSGEFDLALWVAWGAVVGSALQVLVQLPTVVKLLQSLRPALRLAHPEVRTTLRAFGPVLLGRGSVQVSSYIDQWLSSYLPASMVSAIYYAQVLYTLPISLFGMSISAAELPEMSSAVGSVEQISAKVQERLRAGLRNVVFLVVPCAVAFVTIGPTLIGSIFQSGQFKAQDTWTVWVILCGSSIGLTAGTQGRLLNSAYYALGDTKTPLYCALVRVAITFTAGWVVIFPLRQHYGYDPVWGAAGLTGSAGAAAWVEFALLRFGLGRKIGVVSLPLTLLVQAFAISAAAGSAGWAVQRALSERGSWTRAAAVLPLYGAIYLGLALLIRIPEASSFLARLRRRVKR